MKSSYCVSMMYLVSSYFAWSDCYILSSFHLVNGGSPNEGRVEATVIDEDGEELRGVVVSNDRWTIDEANWVCEELEYRHAVFLPDDNRFGRGLQSDTCIFSIDNTTLVVPDCDSDGLGNCSEIEAAGVVCQKPGYLGCFLIRSSELPHINISETSQVLTNEQCLDICMDLSASFAAQRGDTCYCLNNFTISSKERVCNTKCTGNPEQFCGRQQRDSYIIFNVSVGFCPEISDVDLNVYGRYRFGDIVRANCSGGKQLMGDDALQCVGGPDIFQWNGTIPACIDMITIQPRMTSDPSTDQTRKTLTPHLHTDTTSLNTVTMVIDSGSSSIIVLVVAPAVTVVSIVVLMAACLAMYFIKNKRKQSAMKQDDTISYKPKSDVLVHNTKNVLINEDPNYYEVVKNSAPKSSDLDNGVTVLYESADDVRSEPHQYELESPIDTPQHGLIDNVLYKTSWREGDSSMNNYEVFEMESHSQDETSHDQHASPKSKQMKIDLTSNKHEHYFSTDNKLCDEPERSNMTDNSLYNPTDKLNLQTDSLSPNYYEIKSDPIGSHYSEVSSPIADTCPTYHDIQPHPASSPRQIEIGSTLIETPDDTSHEVSKENTTSSIPEYATVNKTARSEKPSDKR